MEKEALKKGWEDADTKVRISKIVKENSNLLLKHVRTHINNIGDLAHTQEERAIIVSSLTNTFAASLLGNICENYKRQNDNPEKFGVYMEEIFRLIKRFCINDLKVDW